MLDMYFKISFKHSFYGPISHATIHASTCMSLLGDIVMFIPLRRAIIQKSDISLILSIILNVPE